jgi:DNA polymerase III alpha subunit
MILKFVQAYEKEKNSQQVSLFGGMSEAAPTHHLQLAVTTPASKQQRLAWEKELLSVYVSEHPLGEYKDKLSHLDPIRALDQAKVDGKVAIGGILTVVKSITTKKGDPMVFATIEDFTGSVEIVVFPKTLKENPALWVADALLIVKGKVNDRDNQRTIIVDHAASLSDTTVRNRPTQLKEAPVPAPIDITGVKNLQLLIDSTIDRSTLADIKKQLTQTVGEIPVTCILQGPEPITLNTNLKISLSSDLILDLKQKLGQERIVLVK